MTMLENRFQCLKHVICFISKLKWDWKGKPSEASPSYCHTTKLYSLVGLQSKRFFSPGMWGLCLGAEYHLCVCNGKWQLLPKTLWQWRESKLIYHLSNCTVRLQEQALSLPVVGGDTLQVLLNSQGSDSPFLIHLQAPFHSREETWPFSLCLLCHYTRVVSILLVGKRHSKNPQCSRLSVCNKEQPLRWGSQGQKGEPRCLSRVSSSSVRDLMQGGGVERFERDKCSQKAGSLCCDCAALKKMFVEHFVFLHPAFICQTTTADPLNAQREKAGLFKVIFKPLIAIKYQKRKPKTLKER
ncbi:hypothetical protein EK904_007383 [Melospiza melodia maxima]|nr:hypothetical protein EK904_007383 [Melospiza melodia maxima]